MRAKFLLACPLSRCLSCGLVTNRPPRTGPQEAEPKIDPTMLPYRPHTLAPSAILAAHLAPSLGRQQSELESRMQQTQAQNVALTETIAAQQQELQRLVGELEGVIEDLDGAGQELDVVLHTEELAREVDGMDEELTQTRSG